MAIMHMPRMPHHDISMVKYVPNLLEPTKEVHILVILDYSKGRVEGR